MSPLMMEAEAVFSFFFAFFFLFEGLPIVQAQLGFLHGRAILETDQGWLEKALVLWLAWTGFLTALTNFGSSPRFASNLLLLDACS